jgi:hypothetical protein
MVQWGKANFSTPAANWLSGHYRLIDVNGRVRNATPANTGYANSHRFYLRAVAATARGPLENLSHR